MDGITEKDADGERPPLDVRLAESRVLRTRRAAPNNRRMLFALVSSRWWNVWSSTFVAEAVTSVADRASIGLDADGARSDAGGAATPDAVIVAASGVEPSGEEL